MGILGDDTDAPPKGATTAAVGQKQLTWREGRQIPNCENRASSYKIRHHSTDGEGVRDTSPSEYRFATGHPFDNKVCRENPSTSRQYGHPSRGPVVLRAPLLPRKAAPHPSRFLAVREIPPYIPAGEAISDSAPSNFGQLVCISTQSRSAHLSRPRDDP